ncbi:uncharacterized protein LOC109533834 isoform X1 [Dendroctonus ponderosae]
MQIDLRQGRPFVIKKTMIRLIILAVLFVSCKADPRSPRIYNVLITSNKNLSPSHAQPVYEPVLRTTSIGYAFPSWLYPNPFVPSYSSSYINPEYSGYRKLDAPLIEDKNVASQNGPYPVPLSADSELKKSNDGENQGQNADHPLNYSEYLQNGGVKGSAVPDSYSALGQTENDPKKVIANLKRNPEIPDVPPPPLPVRVPPAKQ